MTNQSGWTARHLTRRKNEEAEPLIGTLQTETGMVTEKTPPCPCVSPRAPILPRAKARISFQKAKVLREGLFQTGPRVAFSGVINLIPFTISHFTTHGAGPFRQA